jgi:hypothetical protein
MRTQLPKSIRVRPLNLTTFNFILTIDILGYVNTVPARKPAKGASLANPNKRMRTLTALEFED